jgi:hypothetical protein
VVEVAATVPRDTLKALIGSIVLDSIKYLPYRKRVCLAVKFTWLIVLDA